MGKNDDLSQEAVLFLIALFCILVGVAWFVAPMIPSPFIK